MLVLITGITGFVAAHTLDAVLSASQEYRVRGTIRDTKKAKAISDGLLPENKERVEFVQVSDGATSDLTEAMKDVDYVLHIASPYQLNVQDPVKDLLTPAIETTLNVLRAAKAQKSVKKIVLTSSFAAVVDFTKGGPFRAGYSYTAEDWNPLTYEDAVASKGVGAIAYTASKKLAEKAAWDFMASEQPQFTLSTINPPMIYGPSWQGISTEAALNTSTKAIYHLLKSAPQRPDDRMPLFIDVRDVAVAHVKAMEANIDQRGDQRSTQRYLIYSGALLWCDAVKYIADKYPHLRPRLPKGWEEATTPKNMKDHNGVAKLDCSLAAKNLGLATYRNWQSVLDDTLQDLLRLEQSWTSD